MLISLSWLGDFVEFPAGIDPRELAERFTRTTAEVEAFHRVEAGARGLIAAVIVEIADLPGTKNLRRAILDVGGNRSADVVTAAANLRLNDRVVFAPVGARLAKLGEIRPSQLAGRKSEGLIVPADAVGMESVGPEAVFLDPSVPPGTQLDAALFDDWVIEIDNKSITHRPDLWGHYGIAREIAAMYDLPLRPMPMAGLEELHPPNLPEIPLTIADPNACPRYSGLRLTGVPTQPGPLWMQLRLARIGLRPINALVDLTNYVMADLGQPMHAFDAGKVDQIEVDFAEDGERFQTLDGVARTLNSRMLMIQCRGRSIALAGIMGGLDTEVTEKTTSLLLESANFDAATIRKTAVALGLRTDASARFEKSLDPENTVLSIRRFVHLARPVYPRMTLMSKLSDAFPRPSQPVRIGVDPSRVSRIVGRTVPSTEVQRMLQPLGFGVSLDGQTIRVDVPSFRATTDVRIEADVIEEIARRAGYDTIEPTLPAVRVRRFPPNALHELEQRTIEFFTRAQRFHEIQGYIWYDAALMRKLGADPGPCVELVNPAAEGLHMLRLSLMPGLLAAAARNRFHFSSFSLLELGSVFEKAKSQKVEKSKTAVGTEEIAKSPNRRIAKSGIDNSAFSIQHFVDSEFRHLGLVMAQRGRRLDEPLFGRLKSAIESWAWDRFALPVRFTKATPQPDRPWEHPSWTATVVIDRLEAGRVSIVDRPLRAAIDEHLASWSVAWAELRLDGLAELPVNTEPLARIPPFPVVELDFSIVIPGTTPYAEIVGRLRAFSHPLLKSVFYVGSYTGEAVERGRRSLTFRTVLGDDRRTLNEDDTASFRAAFRGFLETCGYGIRA
jgi:phenylalanyl-tRNA synthetase beta chain